MTSVAVVLGVGPGLGAALARKLAHEGYQVAMLARNSDYLSKLSDEITKTGGRAAGFSCDATSEDSIGDAIQSIQSRFPKLPLSVLVYNVAVFTPKPFLEIKPKDIEFAWKSMCLGAFTATQKVIPLMLENPNGGTIIYTGATASLKGGAGFVNLAVPKFGLRALAQSVAREFGPKNIHVVHTIIDGLIDSEKTRAYQPDTSKMMDPDAIAAEYVRLTKQHKSTWTHELDLRPYCEKF